jgi:hypothetical protein
MVMIIIIRIKIKGAKCLAPLSLYTVIFFNLLYIVIYFIFYFLFLLKLIILYKNNIKNEY